MRTTLQQQNPIERMQTNPEYPSVLNAYKNGLLTKWEQEMLEYYADVSATVRADVDLTLIVSPYAKEI